MADVSTYKRALTVMIEALAPMFGVPPELAVEIVRRESGFRPWAVGDDGLAVGLWQWHYPSWQHVRRAMGLPTEDRRSDPFEATITALYALGVLHLDHWWTTAEIARRNVRRAHES